MPEGAKYHVVSFDDQGIRVTDVWESADAFNRFVEQRLMPGVQKVGIAGQPEVEIIEVHRISRQILGKQLVGPPALNQRDLAARANGFIHLQCAPYVPCVLLHPPVHGPGPIRRGRVAIHLSMRLQANRKPTETTCR